LIYCVKGFDAGLIIDIQKISKYQFPQKKLVDNYGIYNFAVPVFPPLGIIIPGSISISLKADLVLSMDLEKAIDFKLSYSKRFAFTLPFSYKYGRLNYPTPSNMFNIYGTQNLNPDFSQFMQIPKFGAEFTLTPG
jgi:hypothetical protein